jgi:hypothetical protein
MLRLLATVSLILLIGCIKVQEEAGYIKLMDIDTSGFCAILTPGDSELGVRISTPEGGYLSYLKVGSGKYFVDFLVPDTRVLIPIVIENLGTENKDIHVAFRLPDTLLEGNKPISKDRLDILSFTTNLDKKNSNIVVLPAKSSGAINVLVTAPPTLNEEIYKEEVWISFSEISEFSGSFLNFEHCSRLILSSSKLK